MPKPDIKDLSISPQATIRDAMKLMTEVKSGLLLVVSEENLLIGVVADGDIRRAIIAGENLETPLAIIVNTNPVTAPTDITPSDLINLMQSSRKFAIPIVDQDGRLVEIEFLENLLTPETLENYAVIMAGGYGTRMQPYTARVPKPMLRIDAKPIIEVIVDRLVQQGINKIIMLLHYKPEIIMEHFAERKFGGREIEFVIEDQPLGTAGGLSLLRDRLTKPFFVMNGDTLIRANWRNMLALHNEQGNRITIGASEYSINIPYGVLEIDEGRVRGITEKPRKSWLTVCSAYCISPDVLDLIPEHVFYNMPDVINSILAQGERVGFFRFQDVMRLENLMGSHQDIWEDEF